VRFLGSDLASRWFGNGVKRVLEREVFFFLDFIVYIRILNLNFWTML